jgi:hypothetical protein
MSTTGRRYDRKPSVSIASPPSGTGPALDQEWCHISASPRFDADSFRNLLWGLAAASAVAASALGASRMASFVDRAEAPRLLPLFVGWAVVAVVVGFRGPRRGVAAIVAFAVVARLPWIGTPPLLSDDLYRYLFEGQAAALGYDVFRYAPAELPGVNDPLRALVNHPEVSSVYPPLALWWFRLLAAAGSVWTTQALTAAVDVVTVGLVARWGSPAGALVLALHPLAVVESAAGAHVDVPAITLATAALAAHRSGNPRLALVAATFGAWLKLFPVVLGPTLLRPLPWPARAAVVAAGLATGVVLAAPHLSFGPHLLVGARAYASTWAFSGFVFPWLAPALGGATRPALAAVAVAVVLGAHARWRDPAVLWAVSGTVFCLTSPTVHPWYVAWALVPSLFLGRGEWALASIGSLLSYRVLLGFDAATGTWTEVPGSWWLVWGTAAIGAILGRCVAGDQLERSVPSATPP